VDATIRAFEKGRAAAGEVFNIGGGETVTLREAIRILEEISGRKVLIERRPPRPGDQQHTSARIEKARKILGYQPTTRVVDGLRAQFEWQQQSARRRRA
jgi:nucleoside-diphosphate-sugar epimerase